MESVETHFECLLLSVSLYLLSEVETFLFMNYFYLSS